MDQFYPLNLFTDLYQFHRDQILQRCFLQAITYDRAIRPRALPTTTMYNKMLIAYDQRL
jgi:hypothetical protein